jgi:glycosyltransferase involved in cell wall biosynthesis
MNAVDVSVVVCTFNRAALLRDTLASLEKLETEDQFRYEVVVVDNGSTDETPALLDETSRGYPVPFRGVREPKPGVAAARNRGIRESTGEWVAFFDDDQVADPRWLAELLALAREKGVRCVAGANRLLLPPGGPPTLAPVCRSLLGETVGANAVFCYKGKDSPGAGNLLLHRSVFDEAGVFDEGLHEAGEDTDLYRRMTAAGIAGWFTPRAISHHVVPGYRLSADYLRWKSFRNGGHLARRNLKEWGRGWFVLELMARLGQALGVHVPRLLWARLRRDADQQLGSRCLLWRAEGYTRFALHLLAPRLFPQRRFLAQVEFRAERELFAQQSPTPQPAVS